MPAVRRVSRSKKRAIEYGRKIVRLRVGPDRHHFTVHEDLLCDSSPYFRRKLQGNRQKMEGNCSICQEEMKVGLKELTYCKSCGGNTHYACMEDWMKKKPTAQQQNTCPLCRADYHNMTSNSKHTGADLNPSGLATYIEWLYTQQISVEDKPDPENDDNLRPDWDGLVQAYIVGVRIEDQTFPIAILEAILETIKDTDDYPSLSAINTAYKYTKGPCGLRELLVQTYVDSGGKTWREADDWSDFSTEFVQDLCAVLMKEHPADDNWDLEAMRKKCENTENFWKTYGNIMESGY